MQEEMIRNYISYIRLSILNDMLLWFIIKRKQSTLLLKVYKPQKNEDLQKIRKNEFSPSDKRISS